MGMGGGGSVTVTTYTYRIRFAVAVSFGPVDTFVRLDYNSDFKNYDVDRGTSESVAFDTGENILYGSFWFGTDTQTADSSLAVMHSGDTLYYRHIAYASFWCDLGMSPSMPATAFTLCRYYCPLAGLSAYNTFADSLGLNAVQVLYDLLTNKFYGFGLSAAIIDTASFLDAGVRLYNENISVGTTLTGGELYNVIRAVLDWIDGELVYDETYGYIKLILRRYDYTYELLPEVFESDMRAQSFELNRTSWYATKNVIYANFLDIARECDQNCVYVEDLGNFNISGNLRVQEFNFDIFTDTATAQRVCNRLLHRHSYPYAKVVFECFGTTGDNLTIFGTFRLYHSYYGIWGKVYRVTEKRRQGPNLWKIEAIEEVFPPASLYDAQSENPYTPPYWTPQVINWNFETFESYYRGFMILCYSEDQSTGYNTLDRFGVQTDFCANPVNYSCIGRLESEVGTNHDANLYLVPDKHFIIDDPATIEYVLVDDEIMKISSCSDSAAEIYYFVSETNRAQEGTSQAVHSVASRVYALDCRALSSADKLPPGVTYDCVITPHYTYPRPFYYPDDKKTTTILYQGLIKAPMQPGAVSVSSSDWTDDITFSWTRNDRVRPLPMPCLGLEQYPSETVGGVVQDQIANWRIQFFIPGTTTFYVPEMIDPGTLQYTSTFASRTAAGLSHYFTFEVCAVGGAGYYDSPYSTYTIS